MDLDDLDALADVAMERADMLRDDPSLDTRPVVTVYLHYRKGPDGDEKDFDKYRGRVVDETATTIRIDSGGCRLSFVKDRHLDIDRH